MHGGAACHWLHRHGQDFVNLAGNAQEEWSRRTPCVGNAQEEWSRRTQWWATRRKSGHAARSGGQRAGRVVTPHAVVGNAQEEWSRRTQWWATRRKSGHAARSGGQRAGRVVTPHAVVGKRGAGWIDATSAQGGNTERSSYVGRSRSRRFQKRAQAQSLCPVQVEELM